jgi:uncharacterized protein YjbI with pentapeptide repeats
MRSITIKALLAAAALCVAMTGTASALPGKANVDRDDLKANTVKSFNIGVKQVKTADIGDFAVRQAQLGLSSVGSDQVIDESLTGADVKDESLTAAEIQNASLTGEDVKDDSLTGDDVQESTLKGFMSSQVRYVFNQANPVPGPAGGNPSSVEVDCPAGERAIGGSAAWIIPNFQDGNVPTALHVTITASMPKPANPGTGDATGWQAHGRNLSGTDRALRVYAMCVPKA